MPGIESCCLSHRVIARLSRSDGRQDGIVAFHLPQFLTEQEFAFSEKRPVLGEQFPGHVGFH